MFWIEQLWILKTYFVETNRRLHQLLYLLQFYNLGSRLFHRHLRFLFLNKMLECLFTKANTHSKPSILFITTNISIGLIFTNWISIFDSCSISAISAVKTSLLSSSINYTVFSTIHNSWFSIFTNSNFGEFKRKF